MKKEKMKKYNLQLNEKQVKELLIALDFYSRISCGQLKEMKEISNTASELTLTKLQKEMFPDLFGLNNSYGIAGTKSPESAKICYDIYKKIMFIFDPVGVYSYKPNAISKEGLPKFEEVKR
jgi:hypothetical protein